MTRIDVVEGGVEFTLTGNDVQVVRTGENGKTLEGDYAALNRDQLMQIYNSVAAGTGRKLLRSFKDKSTAVRRTREALDAYLELGEEPATETAKTERKNSGRRTTYTDDQVVTVLIDHNPRRAGAASHARWEFYRSGATVGETVAAGVLRPDLTWDVRHGHIRVT